MTHSPSVEWELRHFDEVKAKQDAERVSGLLVQLQTPQKAVDASVVKCLEDMLALAKAGDIISVAAGVVYRDRHTGSFASATECLSAQIGAITMLEHDLVDMQRESVTPRQIPEPPAS